MKPTPPKTKPLKEWLFDQANQLAISPEALRMRIERGRHPRPATIKLGRLLFVQLT